MVRARWIVRSYALDIAAIARGDEADPDPQLLTTITFRWHWLAQAFRTFTRRPPNHGVLFWSEIQAITPGQGAEFR